MEKIVTGGIAPTFRLSKNRILHYFGKEITITNNKMQTIEIFHRVGGFYND